MERRDNWSNEQDKDLAETVLTYIRNGKTQLDAFNDVSERNGRTPAACGFRWNKEVRALYEDEIRVAKAERMEVKSTRFKVVNVASTPNVTANLGLSHIKETLERLMDTIDSLTKENAMLKEQLRSRPDLTLEADFQDVVKMLHKAREMYDKAN